MNDSPYASIFFAAFRLSSRDLFRYLLITSLRYPPAFLLSSIDKPALSRSTHAVTRNEWVPENTFDFRCATRQHFLNIGARLISTPSSAAILNNGSPLESGNTQRMILRCFICNASTCSRCSNNSSRILAVKKNSRGSSESSLVRLPLCSPLTQCIFLILEYRNGAFY